MQEGVELLCFAPVQNMLVFVSPSPGEAQVHITVEDSLMLGYKGHKCFLSPLQLGSQADIHGR